jgi:hypothetical protein
MNKLLLLLLIGCASTVKMRVPMTIDFDDIAYYAKFAKAAYEPDDSIKSVCFGFDRVMIRDLPTHKSRYFFAIKGDTCLIAIRGTDNDSNVATDVRFIKVHDDMIDADIHRGFRAATEEVFKDIMKYIGHTMKFQLTGHSLGGAEAVILAMYLRSLNYNVEKIVTFGQPKVTDKKGVKKYRDLPLLRVVNDRDPVPLTPPNELFMLFTGRTYRHFGPAVILLNNGHYAYQNEKDSESIMKNSFWFNAFTGNAKKDLNEVGDHFMKNYITNIQNKHKEVPFSERKKYSVSF